MDRPVVYSNFGVHYAEVDEYSDYSRSSSRDSRDSYNRKSKYSPKRVAAIALVIPADYFFNTEIDYPRDIRDLLNLHKEAPKPKKPAPQNKEKEPANRPPQKGSESQKDTRSQRKASDRELDKKPFAVDHKK